MHEEGCRRLTRGRWVVGVYEPAFAFALVAFALVWIGRASAQIGQSDDPAVTKSVSTVTNKADAVDTTSGACASSQFTDIPGMLVSFKLGGSAARAVIVLFQGVFQLTDVPATAQVRLTIDGIVQSGPNNVTVHRAFTDPAVQTHCFNFISNPVTPGLHVARIQWSGGTGSTCAFDRSLIVLHK